MLAAGDLYLGKYTGLYCIGCEDLKSRSELVNDRCPLHPNRDLEQVDEPSWFFKLSKYQQPLLDHFEKNPKFVMPESRRNEVTSFVVSSNDTTPTPRTSLPPWRARNVATA